MTFDDFKNSLNADGPPAGMEALLAALWHTASNHWDRAHQIVQDIESANAAWIHAYLHRAEGDLGNARYWYARAGRPASNDALEKEWEQIVRTLLGN
jgi:hypothetical protein